MTSPELGGSLMLGSGEGPCPVARRASPKGHGTVFEVSDGRRPGWLECVKGLESDTDEVEGVTGTNSYMAS